MPENSIFDFNSVLETATQVVTRPRQFYQEIPKTGGYTDPLIFVAVMGVAAGLIGAVFSLFSSGHVAGLSFGLISVFTMPIIAIAGCFISGTIMFAVWRLMGSVEDYQTAFRCVAFSTVVFPAFPVLGLVPYLGTIASDAWWIWLMILASIGTHNLEKNKSMLILGVLGIIMVLVGLSGEHSQRHMEARFHEFNEKMTEFNNMNPEQMGEAAGQFLKGLEKATNDP
jgi:hypothetical protein